MPLLSGAEPTVVVFGLGARDGFIWRAMALGAADPKPAPAAVTVGRINPRTCRPAAYPRTVYRTRPLIPAHRVPERKSFRGQAAKRRGSRCPFAPASQSIQAAGVRHQESAAEAPTLE